MTFNLEGAAASARAALEHEQAPRFVGRDRIAAMAGSGVEDARAVLETLVKEGALALAGETAYANRLARPRVHPNEMVSHLGYGAYATLHTVLGESGVANNPSRTVYAIRPEQASGDAVDIRFKVPFGEYRLLSMPREVMQAGEEEDRLEAGGRYPRATPERAFLDWIWLASGKGRAKLADPPLDLDLSDLDRDRIERLAEAMDVAAPLAEWMARHEAALADPAVEGNYSPALGF